MSLKLLNGLETDRTGFTPDNAEPLFTTDELALYVGDGSTAGGNKISGDKIFNGTSDPATVAGSSDKDYYINTTSGNVFRRTSGSWGSPIMNIKGANGSNGTNGTNGSDLAGINNQTGTSYTLVLGDASKLVSIDNASAITLTVPTNASVAIPVNTQIIVRQQGAGIITITPASGVTINNYGGLRTLGQHAVAVLIKIDTNTWLCHGMLQI